MEAVTANAAASGGVGTGSKTIADLLPMAVERHGAAPAQRHKVGEVVGRHLLRGARHDRARDLPRAGGPGHPARRQGGHPGQHAHGVDACVLRDPHRGRGAGHRVPDELRRGVPVRAGPLRLQGRVRRGRRPAREGARDPLGVPCPEPRGGDGPRRRGARRRAGAGRIARARAHPRRGGVATSLRGSGTGRHLSVHLHVGHHRPAEGLPALARQLPLDHRCRREEQRARRRRLGVPLPAPRPRLRDPDPVRGLRPGHHAGLLVARSRSRSSPTCPRSSPRTSRRCRGSSRRSTRWPRPWPPTARSSTRRWRSG